MMLTKNILLGIAALVNIAVGADPGGDTSQTWNATGYPKKPARVDKPVLNPPILDYSEYLVKELKHKTTNKLTMWNDSKINYACKKIFIKEGYKLEDIEMFEVKYEDCWQKPWVMCRHKDAWYQADLMMFYIGLIPVNVRQFNRHFVALPGDDKGGPDVYNDYETVVFKGQASLHNIIANSAKSMGKYVGAPWPVWDSYWWIQAVDANAIAVMNPISQISLEETFAQTTVLAILVKQNGRVYWLDRIPEYAKISALIEEEQLRLGFLFIVLDFTVCENRLLEDSPVGLPHQLPDIKV